MTVAHASIELESAIERHFVRRGHGVEFDMEADWIRAQLPSDARRVVDLGCGGGALLPILGLERVVGVDLSAGGLTLTQRRYGAVPLVCGSADRIPLADGSADALALQHVIEHLSDVSAAMSEWFRALRPGGVLLILTPNADFVDPSVFDDPTHIRLFTASELDAAVRAGGFEPTDLRTLGLPWFRRHERIPGGWRLRRFVTRRARGLSSLPGLRRRGQTLCCAARRSVR